MPSPHSLQPLASESHHILIRVWHVERPILLPRQHHVRAWLCVFVFCFGRNVWKEKFGILHGWGPNFLISWYDTLEWLSPLDWFLGFSWPPCCTPVCKSVVNTGCEDAIWHLFLCAAFLAISSSPFHVFLHHKIVPLSSACLSWMRPGRGWGVFEWFGMQRQHRSVSLQEPSPYLLNGLWAREQKQREAEWEWLDSLQRAGRKRTAAR